MDTEVFFVEPGRSTAEAKAVCAGCPVRIECLEYAVENREKFGIWGGMSVRHRLKGSPRLRRPLSPAPLNPAMFDVSCESS